MKKSLILWISTLLLILPGMVSCSSDDDEEIIPEISGTVIQQVDSSKEVSDFLNQYGWFFLTNEPEGRCVIINSKEEIPNSSYEMQLLLSSGNDTIPDIDFSKYSLVIGYHMVGNNVREKIPKEKKQQTLYDSEGSYVFELGYTYQKIEENHATVAVLILSLIGDYIPSLTAIGLSRLR